MSTTANDSLQSDALKRALYAVKDLRAKLEAAEQAKREPIAIVGMGCRLPGGVQDAESYWRLLQEGRDAVSEIPPDRWNLDAFYDPDPEAPGKMYTRAGSFVADIDKFDAKFFGIAPREAASMDPQQRMLLEVSWEALENAAIAPDRLRESQTGVFVGISTNDFSHLLTRGNDPATIDPYTGTGGAFCVAAGRISYVLGLHGPNFAVDTACSSSLVAVHLACQSLRARQCELALAGGVNLILIPEPNVYFTRMRAISPDGRCKTFDAAADGYGRGEGCGMIVLKRLSDALRDGDNVLALIRGSAINHDGKSSGLTVPNGRAQQAVIRAALAEAGIDPLQVSYVDAHGTGTPLGDPIEIRALAAALCRGRSAERGLIVGSAKTNFGHLEAAAGIAGLLKVVLALQHREIPPHLHFKNPNPHIPWHELPIEIPTAKKEWRPIDNEWIAGVSSFGFSGTNAHVVLSGSSPVIDHQSSGNSDQPSGGPAITERCALVALSAKTEPALRELAQRYERHLAVHSNLALADVAFTANTGRAHFAHRLAAIAESTDLLREQLAAFAAGNVSAGVWHGHFSETADPPKIAFLFTGQGAQYAGMGRRLYETQPVFREALDQCAGILRAHLERPLLEVIFQQPVAAGDRPPADSGRSSLNTANLLDQTAYTQPALFALEYALAELWRSWGIQPGLVMGHSVGEYVAACVAGMMSLSDGLKLIAARARLMQALPQNGAMMAVYADETLVGAELAPYADRAAIAAVNGPRNVVISGERRALEEIIKKLEAAGIKHKPLAVSHAFHSPLMEPVLDELERAASTIAFKTPRLGFVSNLTGKLCDFRFKPDGPPSALHDPPSYWRRHAREAVRFSASIEHLKEQGCSVFLEIGPHPTLLGMAGQCVPEGWGLWIPSLRKGQDDGLQMLKAAAAFYTHGVEIDWPGFHRHHPCRRVVLPAYPFQRERHWIDERQAARSTAGGPSAHHPLLGQRLQSPLIKEIIYESECSTAALPFLQDHCVFGSVVFPAAAYIETALAAGRAAGWDLPVIAGLSILDGLFLAEQEARALQTVLSGESSGAAHFQIYSAPLAEGERKWTLHVEGELRASAPASATNGTLAGPPALAEWRARGAAEESMAQYYQMMRANGLEYGPGFQGLQQLWRGEGEALGLIRLPQPLRAEARQYGIHPALLDCCFQVLGAATAGNGSSSAPAETYLPIGLEKLEVYAPVGTEAWCHVSLPRAAGERAEMLSGDLCVFEESGRMLLKISGLRLKRADRGMLQRAMQQRERDCLYEIAWQPQTLEHAKNSAPGGNRLGGQWLIFADRGGAGEFLASRLNENGASCTLIFAGGQYENTAANRFTLNPLRPEDFQRVFQRVQAAGPLAGIAHFWSLESLFSEEAGAASLAEAMALSCGSVLHLLHAAANAAGQTPARLWLVTRGAVAVDNASGPVAPAQAALWGLARTLSVEHPDLRCVRVDLGPEPESVRHLFEEIEAGGGEDQIAFRQGRRYAARLVRVPVEDRELRGDDRGPAFGEGESQSSDKPVQLQITARGMLENLVLQPVARRAPGPGEVEIRVQASGLNFRDVLNALGMYPGDPGPLGGECAGTVAAVGAGVADLRVGDEVMALGPACFSTFVTTKAEYVVRKPASFSFEEAATIPIAFLTAYYGLHHLAKIAAGERVFIHAAAGGVGIAAVRLAQRAGAVVFASASPAKWDFVKSLGVQHLTNSRTLDFAGEVMAATKGEGVHVVLNSLAGEFIAKSVSMLAANGRFLEIGKRGIWSDEQMARVRPDVSNFVYDLGHVMINDPALIQSMFRELRAAFENGELQALPLRTFPLQEAASAFRHMAGAKHIGKIVLTQKRGDRGASMADRQSKPGTTAPRFTICDSRSAYLITGGLGALGLKVAEWLAAKGAKHLVLAGRKPPSEHAGAAIAKMKETGANIVVALGDLSQEKEIERILAGIAQAGLPLRGIVHAAGVLDDGILLQQTWPRFVKVMAPKVEGTWHLHRLTRDLPLDFFVMFSSMAAMFGASGQGNYAAANAFMDGLAHYRRARGLPALSINWGPWAEAGMAAELGQGREQRMRENGISPIAPEQGVRLLEQALNGAAAQVAVVPVTWPKFLQQFPPGKEPPLFLEIAKQAKTSRGVDAPAAPAADIVQELQSLLPAERLERLTAHVHEQALKVLGLAASHTIDLQQPLSELGLDSLMAVELRNALGKSVQQSLPATLLFDHPTIESLTGYLAEHALGWGSLAKPAKESKPNGGNELVLAAAEVKKLSEDEVEASIAAELEKLMSLK